MDIQNKIRGGNNKDEIVNDCYKSCYFCFICRFFSKNKVK